MEFCCRNAEFSNEKSVEKESCTMKQRSGFVTNSSSSSFLIRRDWKPIIDSLESSIESEKKFSIYFEDKEDKQSKKILKKKLSVKIAKLHF